MANCRVTGDKLDEYFVWENFPMSNTCTLSDIKEDVFYNFGLGVSKIGLIQQLYDPNPDILYKESHNSSVGKIWERHNYEFVKFLNRQISENDKLCEIGSGNGKIVNMINSNNVIDCYDPTPSFEETKNIKLIKSYFETSNIYDLIFCSHTLEHILDIQDFLHKIKNSLSVGGRFVFSVPNSEFGFDNNIITTLNTEHIYYFTKTSIHNTLSVCGFKIIDFQNFDDHSMFVSCVVDSSNIIDSTNYNMDKFIENLYSSIENVKNIKECYIFGCHMMSSIFLHFNKTNNVSGVIDNDKLKHGKRLYGTSLICNPPTRNNISNIILNGGIYHNEIEISLSEYYNIHSWKYV